MTEVKNIYDVLEEMDFENKCEKYALGFRRDTDTPTMTKFRQESAKEFAFSLIQEFYERALSELAHTKKKLDRAIWWLNEIVENHRFTPITTAEKALAEINQKEEQ